MCLWLPHSLVYRFIIIIDVFSSVEKYIIHNVCPVAAQSRTPAEQQPHTKLSLFVMWKHTEK